MSEYMEKLPLLMILNTLSSLPEYELPAQYRSRFFSRGDEPVWAEIEKEAGEFASVQSGIEQLRTICKYRIL